MKRIVHHCLACVCSLILLASRLDAQWVQTAGPEGGYPQSFTTVGSTIFAASFAGGVFKSSDNGEHWFWTGPGLPVGTDSRAITNDGVNLYVGTSAGVYKSTDGGAVWAQSSTGISTNNIGAVFATGSWVFAGTRGSGVFRSSNQGTSWAIDTVGLTSSALTVRSFTAIGSTIFVGTAGGVFKSSDFGATWIPSNTSLGNTDVNALANLNNVLLAGTQGSVGIGGVFRSTDNGTSWSGGQNEITLALAVSGSNVFKSGLGGISRSTDAGLTWTLANNGIPVTNNVRALGVLGTSVFAGMGNNGDRGGVFRSTDLGASWVEKNVGCINTQVYTLIKVTSGLFAGCADGSLYKSTDNGTVWTFLKNFGTGVTAHYEGGTYMYVGTGASAGSVHRSSDGGATWLFAGTGLPTSGTIRGLVGIGGYIIAGSSSGGVYRTLDATWSASNTGLTNTTVNALTTFGIYTFAGTNGGVFISTNSGTNWAASNSGLTTLSVQTIFCPSTSIVYVGTSGGGVFKSTDNGASWAAVNTGLTGTNVRALAGAGSNIFAGTSLGVFASTNGGANWTAANTGLNNTSVQCLNLDTRNFLTAGTLGNGAWRRPYAELTAVDQTSSQVPWLFSLYQNYPNPFNPSTTIRFDLISEAHVELRVFNLLGEEVATVVDESRNAGHYAEVFDARNLPSGAYMYRLKAGALTMTRKLMLIR